MFKKFVIGLVVVGLIFGLSGVAVAKKVEITILGVLANKAYEKLLVEAFEREHPEISIEFERVPAGKYWDALVLAAATGTIADVFGTDTGGHLDLLVREKVLRPMDDLYEAVGIDVSKYLNSKYLSQIFTPLIRNGNFYGIPSDVYTGGFINYNKSLFDVAGIAYLTENITWEEFREIARKLTVKDEEGNVTRYGTFCKWPQAYMVPPFGGKMVDDYLRPTKVLFGEEKYVSGMKAYLDMIAEGTMLTRQEFKALGGSKPKIWCEEKIATIISSLGGFENVNFDWDVVAMPIMNEDSAYYMSIGCWSISSICKNPVAAMEWLKFRSLGREALKIREVMEIHANAQVPWAPELQTLYEQIAIGRKPANWKCTFKTFERPDFSMACEGATEFSPIFGEAVVSVMEGTKSLDHLVEAAEEAQKVIDDLPWNKK